MDEELDYIREKKRRELMAEMNQTNDKSTWPGVPVEITDSNFESNVKQYSSLIVDCWAPWCGPCRMIAPTVEALAKDYKGKIAFGKLNTDENMGVSTKFGIMSIPTLLFFKDGKLVDKMIGAVPRGQIEDRMKKIL